MPKQGLNLYQGQFMSRRNIIQKYQVYTDSDSTLNESSKQSDISGVDNVTYSALIDSSVNGELKVTVCNDKEITTDSEFKPLDFGEQTIISSANGLDYIFKISNHGFKWMRLEFTNNGGAGLINAWISGNTVGA